MVLREEKCSAACQDKGRDSLQDGFFAGRMGRSAAIETFVTKAFDLLQQFAMEGKLKPT